VRADDLLVLFTDGVVEAVNSQGEEFGMDRLVALLTSSKERSPDEIVDLVYKKVIEFSGSELQYDDFTMLVTRFFGTIRDQKQYHVSLPARVESVPTLRDFVLRACHSHGLAGQDVEDILLAADEAATNVILHAYKGAESASEFDCRLDIQAGVRLRIEMTDKGAPFNQDAVPGPDVRENMAGRRRGGFGVYLIRSLMDRVDYFRKDDLNYFVAEKTLKKDEES